MVTLDTLFLPIVLSAVLVFITSSILHMVLRYHRSDYAPLPNEEAVRAAINAGNPTPAQYIIPYASDPKAMDTPEMRAKQMEGPVAVLRLRRPGPFSMGAQLGQWFAFTLVVSLFVAYAASHSIAPGTPYLQVFRVVGTIALLAYVAGQIPGSIWMAKPWSVAWKEALDGLVYALLTAGVFGWLWPR